MTGLRHSPILIGFVCWGEDFVRTLLDLTIPSLLSPNNLPKVAERHRILFRIYTFGDDIPVFEASPIMTTLESFADVRILTLERGGDFESKYECMTFGHEKILSEAVENEAACIPLYSDFLVSDGSLDFLAAMFRSGVDCICAPAVCTKLEAMRRQIAAYRAVDGSLRLTGRQLSMFVLENLYPTGNHHFWGGEKATSHTGILYWRLNDHAMLVRVFHTVPALVYLSKRDGEITIPGTLDSGFVGEYFPDPRKILFVHDSDDFLYCEMSGEGTRLESANARDLSELSARERARAWIDATARWCLHFYTPHLLYFGRQHMIIHGKDVTESDHKTVKISARQINAVARRMAVLRWVTTFDTARRRAEKSTMAVLRKLRGVLRPHST